MRRCLQLLIGMVMIPMPAAAIDPAVSVRLGSLGFGVEAGLGLTDQFSTRLDLSRYDIGLNERVDGIEYDLDLEWRSIALFADWHPFESAFRFTAGMFRNNSDFSGSANAASLTIGSSEYRGVGLDADVRYRSYAPYLGLGWETDLLKANGWGFNVDLGILYQGSGEVSLNATGFSADIVDPVDIAQAERDFEKDIEEYKYYPVFSFGIAYKF